MRSKWPEGPGTAGTEGGAGERGAARKKIPCERRKAGESRRGEAGLSEERKPKRAEGHEIM